MNMENLQLRVEKFIKDENLLSAGSSVILGVSGGADSIALLNILHRAGYKVIVAHCNFHLRAKESMRDENFVKEVCSQGGFTYKSINFDTLKYAAQNSLSIEMAARELRYKWFEDLRQEFNAESIAVAHHKDDSVETVIMNMLRGTGIKGLTGIDAKVGYIIRPFLCVTRHEVEDYIKQEQLSYVDDSSNSESIYTRNIVRLDVMPYFERINPSAKQAIHRTMQNLRQVENIYQTYIKDAKDKVLQNGRINILELKKTIEPAAVLYEILSSYNFNPATIEDIYEGLDGLSGKIFLSDTHKLLKDRDFLILEFNMEKKKIRS